MKIGPIEGSEWPAFQKFAEATWRTRPRDRSFYDWRYRNAPELLTLGAITEGSCVASISAFHVIYRSKDQKIQCLEPFDWFCMPEFRRIGLGIKLMRAMMHQPVVSIGGSSDTISLLPLFNFRLCGEGRQMVRPLTSRAFLHQRGLAKLLAVVFDCLGSDWFSVRVASASLRCELVERFVPDDLILNPMDGTYSEPSLNFLNWLSEGVQWVGRLMFFRLVEDSSRVGWAVARIRNRRGAQVADLIECRFDRRLDTTRAAVAVESICNELAQSGADVIISNTSCPFTLKVLKKCRFVQRQLPLPVFIWPADILNPSLPVRIGGLRGDGAFFPYHELTGRT